MVLRTSETSSEQLLQAPASLQPVGRSLCTNFWRLRRVEGIRVQKAHQMQRRRHTLAMSHSARAAHSTPTPHRTQPSSHLHVKDTMIMCPLCHTSHTTIFLRTPCGNSQTQRRNQIKSPDMRDGRDIPDFCSRASVRSSVRCAVQTLQP